VKRQTAEQQGISMRHVDKLLKPHTYARPLRVLCWLVWKTPLKKVALLRWKNPYCTVVDVYEVRGKKQFKVEKT